MTLSVNRIDGVNWVGLQTLIKREVSRFMSVSAQTIIGPVVTLLLYFMIFSVSIGHTTTPVPGVTYLMFLAPGLVMMSMVQNAFANTSSSLMIAKIQGSIVDVLLPPLSALELLIGFLVGGVVRGLVVGLTCTIVMMLLVDLPLPHLGLLLTFAILGNAMMASLGIIGGLWAQKFDHIAALTNFVVTPLTFLSGTFYAIQQLPPFWQGVAHLNPFHHMIDGYRAAYTGVVETDLLLAVGSLVFFNILLFIVAWRMLYTGYRTKS